MIEYYKNKSLQPLFYINKNGLICQEEWRDIPNYEGFYQASDLGRIKSLSRYVKNAWGYYWTKEIILTQCNYNSKKMYLGLNLHKEGDCKKFMPHVLVAMTFLGHVPDGKNTIVVDHINNNSLDNRLCNLQVITQRKNASKDRKGSSQYTGVQIDKRTNKWTSRIRIGKQRIALGTFVNEKDASDAYQLALNNWENLGIKPSEKITSSKYKGISWRKDIKKWAVRIEINKKRVSLGVFDNEYDAHLTYQKAFIEKNKPSD
jgi:hypothetical protein